jgi:hypothetical protein
MSILGDIKLIGQALREAGKIELYEKLLAIQEKSLEVQEENKTFIAEIEELKRISSISGKLQFRDNAYHLPGDDGPYCSCCWDNEKKLVRLHELIDCFWCPVCKNYGPIDERNKEDDET